MADLRPRLPRFATEMAEPRHRAKLWWGIGSGYAIAAAFAGFAMLGHVTGIFPVSFGIVVLILVKVITNTLAWIALRTDRFTLEASGLNMLADVLAMTGAIYVTGGIASPLLPIYAIELTVIALITNVGVTVMTGMITFTAYATMLALVRVGVLPTVPSILDATGGATDVYILMALIFAAFVLGVPTAFASSILARLRANEATLLARTEQLVEAGRNKSQFIANITHELRTPIHGICGLSDLIDAGVYGPVTDAQKCAVEDIKKSAMSLLRMIDDMLTLAREDAGRLEYRPTHVDIDELLASVMATVGFLRGTRPLKVTLDAPSGLPPLSTDRPKLVQILVNLLANAVKFTPDGGHVVLRARMFESRLEFAVEDDGIGISEAELPHVFEPFRQVDGSEQRRYGGAGLGLALVERLARLLGGEVLVQSEAGAGSTFTVRLPVSSVSGDASAEVRASHQ